MRKNKMKKGLHFANRYWGDITWLLVAPFNMYFYYLVINNPIDPVAYLTGIGEKVPAVNQLFSWALFGFNFAFTIISAFRILFRKKYSLRDFHYLIVGIIATYCFVGFIVPWFADVPYLGQEHFLNGVKVLQRTTTTFATSRAAIWLYKWFEGIDTPKKNAITED